MSQWGFYFNQNRCVGCKTCTLACKTWNDKRRGDAKINVATEATVMANGSYYQPVIGGPESSFSFIDPKTGTNNYTEMRKYHMKEDWRRVTTHDQGAIAVDPITNAYTTTFEREYLSLGCNHCKNPECLNACPMNVYYKEEEHGLTLYDNSACISCGKCKQACPWGVPQFYDPNFAGYALNDPNRPRMTKCTGCLDRLREGLKPACVAACWQRALDFGPMDELMAKYNHEFVTELPEFKTNGTGPMIIFRPKKNKTGV